MTINKIAFDAENLVSESAREPGLHTVPLIRNAHTANLTAIHIGVRNKMSATMHQTKPRA